VRNNLMGRAPAVTPKPPLGTAVRLLLLNPAAGIRRAGGIDGGRALINVLNLTLSVNNKRGSAGISTVAENAVGCRDLAHEVAHQRKFRLQLSCPVSQSGLIVGTDGENLSFRRIEILDTRLVSGEFFGSATGEGCGKEGQYNGLLATEIGEGDGLSCAAREREIGGGIADLKMGLAGGDRLSRKHRRAEQAQEREPCQGH